MQKKRTGTIFPKPRKWRTGTLEVMKITGTLERMKGVSDGLFFGPPFIIDDNTTEPFFY